LAQPLKPAQVGGKAATLAQLYRWGYPVPPGWVLPAGDDPTPLIAQLQPSAAAPLVVRSSAVGEDTLAASAAGQYQSILGVTSRAQLVAAIHECQQFYSHPQAQRYRQDHDIPEASGMAVLVQTQIIGQFSGVAFSRDPVQQEMETVAIEALPGAATQIVSGKNRPEAYQVLVPPELTGPTPKVSFNSPDLDIHQFSIQGDLGQVPPDLLCRVALLARELEARYHGIPQDLEWSFDGQRLWVLQTRPITTLAPIWTRKIAAEVIPGVIHPLTWSINRPLTCGVWGQLFTLVLGRRAADLDFPTTATLHWGRAYFNASLLGTIFRRMGLPPESLEFLTRGAKMSRPSLGSTLGNLWGLGRLLRRELSLETDFQRDQTQLFRPLLSELAETPPHPLPPRALKTRMAQILAALEPATYYSILAPLSAALRLSLLKVPETDLDTSQTPEAASLQAIQSLANSSRDLLGDVSGYSPEQLYLQLSEHPAGNSILAQLNALIDRYGYLSAVGTNIAIPTWREDPQPVRVLFQQLLLAKPASNNASNPASEPAAQPTTALPPHSWRQRLAQQRLNLKGLVAASYDQLLAELRWTVLALEQHWLNRKILTQAGDIFFLDYTELEVLLDLPAKSAPSAQIADIQALIQQRRQQFQIDQARQSVPDLVFGAQLRQTNLSDLSASTASPRPVQKQLQGIGASPGQMTGPVKVIRQLSDLSPSTAEFFTTDLSQTILVVPYTDAGWGPLLAQAGGLIAEVGGRLSHGAIIAREYQIPAVMEISQATQRFEDGQWVRMDGTTGWVELLGETPEPVPPHNKP
jgi:phosphohistidine swiveling domain-containing protein